MTDLEIVRHLTGRLEHLATLLRSATAQPGDLVADEDRRDLLAFRVYLGIQTAIDLASHVIADEGWGPVASLREHFELLAQRAVITSELASSLSAGVKVRNLVGHAYGNIDPDRLLEAARALPDLLSAFAQAMLSYTGPPA